MKKLILITAFLFLGYTEISAQQSCTYCYGTTTGSSSSAIGKNTVSTGFTSFASGFGSQAKEAYTTALGFYSFATYSKATAIGSTVKSSGYQSIVLGSGDYNTGNYLINNIPRSLMIGFHSIYPTLFVVGDDTPNVFNKTGRIGIGNVTNPQAKLHILADVGEDASLLIQPATTDWNNGQPAAVLLGNAENGLFATKTNGLSFQSPMNYTFGNNLLFINKNGNVGIGIEGNLPETKLDVNGTVKMTGLRLLDQNVNTGYVLTCSGINGQAIWQNPDAFSTWTVNDAGDIYRNSKVGILTSEPQAELDVNGNALVNSALIGKITTAREVEWVDPDFLNIVGSSNANAAKIMIPKGNNTSALPLKIINPALNGEIQFFAGPHPNMVLRTHEFVVGNGNTNVDLKVNGKIWTHEVEVKLTDWWDEVLTKDYKLMPLNQLESYIATNKHLPDIPTEKEVLKNGVDLGEMNALLLKKVEELTLYVIELKKENEAIKKQIERIR